MNWNLKEKNIWHGIIWNSDDYDDSGSASSITSTLDIPHPWSPALVFDRKKILELCPLGYKVINQMKMRIELFGKYKQPDGLIKRQTYFDDFRRVIVNKVSS